MAATVRLHICTNLCAVYRYPGVWLITRCGLLFENHFDIHHFLYFGFVYVWSVLPGRSISGDDFTE